MAEAEITTIPQLRRVFSDTKANLDAMTGLRDAALGYGTDTGILYRQNGAGAANWSAITLGATLRDTKANLDALTGLADGTLAYGTDTATFYRQNGAGAANWEIVSTVSGATQEFWAPPGFGSDFPNVDNSYQPAALINANLEQVNISFIMPADFTSLVEAVLVVVPNATATMRLTFTSQYGGVGQLHNVHAETDADVDTALTDNTLAEIDISGVLSSLAAGDYVGARAIATAVNVPNLAVIGIRIKYA